MNAGMKKALRVPVAAMGCFALLAAGGCSRSSDGSVVVNAPPRLAFAVPPYLRPDGPGAGGQATVASTSFPPPPPAPPAVRGKPRAAAPRVETWKVAGVKPPFERADPETPLTCRDETGDGGRIKVVCE